MNEGAHWFPFDPAGAHSAGLISFCGLSIRARQAAGAARGEGAGSREQAFGQRRAIEPGSTESRADVHTDSHMAHYSQPFS